MMVRRSPDSASCCPTDVFRVTEELSHASSQACCFPAVVQAQPAHVGASEPVYVLYSHRRPVMAVLLASTASRPCQKTQDVVGAVFNQKGPGLTIEVGAFFCLCRRCAYGQHFGSTNSTRSWNSPFLPVLYMSTGR